VRYVVDTNIAIAMLAQRQPVVERLSSVAPEDLGLSVIVIAEMLFGARRSAKVSENVARVQRLEA
jgi:tRNA(fMet)-specific endonuclease VapC